MKTHYQYQPGEEVCKIGTFHNGNQSPYYNNKRNINISSFKKLNSQNDECGRCGRRGHKSSDQKCPARGKKCNKRGKVDHFAWKCLTKDEYNYEPKPKVKKEVVRIIKPNEK